MINKSTMVAMPVNVSYTDFHHPRILSQEAGFMHGMDVAYKNGTPIYSKINQDKMDFTDLYTSGDPRSYFLNLGKLNYIIPHLAQPIFNQLIRARRDLQDDPVNVLDLGCSYAINGALMKYALNYETLRRRYTAPALQNLSSDELLDLDRRYYQGWPKREDVRVIGLDISANAIRYAEKCALLDCGLAVNLENRDLTPDEAADLRDVDIIVSTGCIGYVTSKTFERIFKAIRPGRRAPWVASFVLRMFPFDAIEDTLSTFGLVTEPYEGATFVQRRFANPDEMAAAIRAVEARGLNAHGHEAEGLYHANLYLSRPAAEIGRKPVQKLVSVVSGVN